MKKIFMLAIVLWAAVGCQRSVTRIEHFARTPADAGLSCGEVCTTRLGIDGWTTKRLDACAETLTADKEPGVACVREQDFSLVERSRRLETILAPVGVHECTQICGTGIRANESDLLVACDNTFTKYGRPAAICAIEWDSPSSHGF